MNISDKFSADALRVDGVDIGEGCSDVLLQHLHHTTDTYSIKTFGRYSEIVESAHD